MADPPIPRGFLKSNAEAAIWEWAEAKKLTDRLWETVLQTLTELQESPTEYEKP